MVSHRASPALKPKRHGPKAAKQVDVAVRGLEARCAVPTEVIAGTDEELAKAALPDLAVLALGPMKDRRTRSTWSASRLHSQARRETRHQQSQQHTNGCSPYCKLTAAASGAPPRVSFSCAHRPCCRARSRFFCFRTAERLSARRIATGEDHPDQPIRLARCVER